MEWLWLLMALASDFDGGFCGFVGEVEGFLGFGYVASVEGDVCVVGSF